jgi:hypothetical protein
MNAQETGAGCTHLLALLGAVMTIESDEADVGLPAALLEHLATCPECRASEGRLTALLTRYQAESPQLPDDLADRLVAQVCGRFPPQDDR